MEKTNEKDGHVATNTINGKAAWIHRNETTRHITPTASTPHPNP